jgi:hypothetical protein
VALETQGFLPPPPEEPATNRASHSSLNRASSHSSTSSLSRQASLTRDQYEIMKAQLSMCVRVLLRLGTGVGGLLLCILSHSAA